MTLLILLCLGLIVGSFLNVVIYRLPMGEDFVKGRSRCLRCLRELAWYDLIPLMSFVLLRARCRNCREQISWQYPIIELISAVLWVSSFLLLAQQGLAYWLFSLALLEIFLLLAVIDIKHLILPDSIMVFGVGLSLAYGILERAGVIANNYQILTLGHFAAAGVAMLTLYLLWLYSKGRWIGFGDVKLLGLIGLIFGLGIAPIAYSAVIGGAIVGILLLAFQRAGLKTQLPFGAFLAVAVSVYILFGWRLFDHIYIFQLMHSISI